MHALFLKHCAKPGRRDELESVWRRHMMPAIDGNDGHLTYIYSFGAEPDTVGAFQIYRSKEDADTLVNSCLCTLHRYYALRLIDPPASAVIELDPVAHFRGRQCPLLRRSSRWKVSARSTRRYVRPTTGECSKSRVAESWVAKSLVRRRSPFGMSMPVT